MEKTFLFIIAIFGLLGCEDNQPIVANYNLVGNFIVPTSVSIAASTQLPPEQIANVTDSVLNANGLRFSDIRSIQLSSVTLATNDTLVTNMEFLREINLSIQSSAEPPLLVASSGDLPEILGDSVVLVPTPRNLSPYLTKDTLEFWPTLIADQTVLTNTQIKVRFGLIMETK